MKSTPVPCQLLELSNGRRSCILTYTNFHGILRYEIYLDEVKPKDLSVNFLQEFMDLPLSYLAPGAAVKFRKYIIVLFLLVVDYCNLCQDFSHFDSCRSQIWPVQIREHFVPWSSHSEGKTNCAGCFKVYSFGKSKTRNPKKNSDVSKSFTKMDFD